MAKHEKITYTGEVTLLSDQKTKDNHEHRMKITLVLNKTTGVMLSKIEPCKICKRGF